VTVANFQLGLKRRPDQQFTNIFGWPGQAGLPTIESGKLLEINPLVNQGDGNLHCPGRQARASTGNAM